MVARRSKRRTVPSSWASRRSDRASPRCAARDAAGVRRALQLAWQQGATARRPNDDLHDLADPWTAVTSISPRSRGRRTGSALTRRWARSISSPRTSRAAPTTRCATATYARRCVRRGSRERVQRDRGRRRARRATQRGRAADRVRRPQRPAREPDAGDVRGGRIRRRLARSRRAGVRRAPGAGAPAVATDPRTRSTDSTCPTVATPSASTTCSRDQDRTARSVRRQQKRSPPSRSRSRSRACTGRATTPACSPNSPAADRYLMIRKQSASWLRLSKAYRSVSIECDYLAIGRIGDRSVGGEGPHAAHCGTRRSPASSGRKTT